MPVRPTALALLVFLSLSAWANEHLSERMPAREGETCQVCSGKVGKGDAAYLANGQRVALHAADCCEGKFLKEPQVHTASLRPNSIQASGVAGGGLAGGWLWVGVYILIGLVFGGLSSHLAVRKGFSPIMWYLYGFLFSVAAYLYLRWRTPVPGVPQALAGLAKVPLTRQPVPCAACGYANHPSAEQCLGCGARLEALVPSEVSVIKRS